MDFNTPIMQIIPTRFLFYRLGWIQAHKCAILFLVVCYPRFLAWVCKRFKKKNKKSLHSLMAWLILFLTSWFFAKWVLICSCSTFLVCYYFNACYTTSFIHLWGLWSLWIQEALQVSNFYCCGAELWKEVPGIHFHKENTHLWNTVTTGNTEEPHRDSFSWCAQSDHTRTYCCRT